MYFSAILLVATSLIQLTVSQEVTTPKTSILEIINGQPAQRGKYPFVAALIAQQGRGQIFCGGALISKEYVLTAKHCVEGTSTISVLLGGLNKRDNGGRIYTSRQIMKSPSSDLAIVKMTPPIQFTETTEAACIDTSGIADRLQTAKAVGWGDTSYNQSRFPETLMEVDLPVNRCQSDRICVGTQSGVRAICHGDSGSPLFVATQSGFVLLGVAWYVSGWQNCRSPGAYTKINTPSNIAWINKVTNNNIKCRL